ncbi:MAG: hypothetical protein J6S54_08905 [Lentisphaeria bacterium]|nr:hypothetical protein [Lentisphaeria bacterium]
MLKKIVEKYAGKASEFAKLSEKGGECFELSGIVILPFCAILSDIWIVPWSHIFFTNRVSLPELGNHNGTTGNLI